ncbi:MAG TPA: LysR family transcriptional regulator [Thermoanaerobaculia bacterium]|nr:LysR family transcriptional regulator [Thermoanaerobaculia bacterium]
MAAPALDLDLAHLRTFHAVVKAGGFSAAAERLHRTQSAVSHAVNKLERSAKVRRSSRPPRARSSTRRASGSSRRSRRPRRRSSASGSGRRGGSGSARRWSSGRAS